MRGKYKNYVEVGERGGNKWKNRGDEGRGVERGISRGREMRGDEKREGRLLRGGEGGGGGRERRIRREGRRVEEMRGKERRGIERRGEGREERN